MISADGPSNARILLAFVLCAFGILLALSGLGVSTGAPAQAEGRGGAKDGPREESPGGGILSVASYHNDVSPPLRSLPPEPARGEAETRREANENPKIPHIHLDRADPVVQNARVSALALLAPAIPQPSRNFDGIAFPGVGCNCAPPDPVGAVGATQYVQMVNEGYQVFDKDSGASVLGPNSISSIWTGFGGNCQNGGTGDPIVLYDHIANRWVISQFAGIPSTGTITPTDECIAVSTTSDATGTYNRYGFHLGSNFFNFPKLSVWPDGYYMSMTVYNAAGTTYLGPQAFAFDRAKMIAGAPATFVTPGITGGPNEDHFLPADLDGGRMPAAGAPAIFVEIPFTSTYRVFHFHADFATPANTNFSLFASPAAAGFTELCPGTRACVPQISSAELLEGIGDRLMFRLAYRNFGDHEAVVGNFSVQSGGVAGIRWFELRNVTFGPVNVFQESTYQPDSVWRWMGSAAMDQGGNLAIGFSASSPNIFPQIRYAGRLATDAPNTLAQGEAHLFDGTGSQVSTGNRWGDYSSLSVDPVDDCTFWYTNEYYATTGPFNWRTRIGSFKFPQCPPPSATFKVTTIADHDDGVCDAADCTLREALNAANAAGGSNLINFAPSVTGIIQLGSALPSLIGNLTLQGPGADVLTIRRNTGGNYRIFTVNPGASVSLSGLTITNGNGGLVGGGGVYSNHATVSLTSCSVTGNSASSGGGIYNDAAHGGSSTVTIDSSTVSANSAFTSTGEGGGIYNDGSSGGNAALRVTNSTVSGNTTVNFPTTAALENIATSGTASARFTNCTFSGNALFTDSATLILGNNIFNAAGGGATLGNRNGGLVLSKGHNLSSDSGAGFLTAAGDKIQTNPQLDPAGLNNNGGPTNTIALLSNSPAIEMGDDTLAPKLDQRGFARVGTSDIGAFEFGGRAAVKITSITRLANGHIALQATGVPNASHTVQAAPTAIFSSMTAAAVTADGTGAIHYDDAGAVGQTTRFYRLTYP